VRTKWPESVTSGRTGPRLRAHRFQELLPVLDRSFVGGAPLAHEQGLAENVRM
jgi:hypothetical protein